MSGKKRPHRTERRAGERATRKLVHDRQRLATLEAGGAPDRPITVTSSSVIEVRARSMLCPLCAGNLLVDEHSALMHEGHSLRAAHVTCQLCGVKRAIYFAITSPLLS